MEACDILSVRCLDRRWVHQFIHSDSLLSAIRPKDIGKCAKKDSHVVLLRPSDPLTYRFLMYFSCESQGLLFPLVFIIDFSQLLCTSLWLLRLWLLVQLWSLRCWWDYRAKVYTSQI